MRPTNDGNTLRRSMGPRGLDRLPSNTPRVSPYIPAHPKRGTSPISALAMRIWI